MYIYPSSHNVNTTEEITANHIPLAYFTKAKKDIKPSIKIEEPFCHSAETTIVYPYQRFTSGNVLLFDAQNEPVDSTKYLKRNGADYYFEPAQSVEFVPQPFSYSLLCQRDDIFRSDINYKFNVGCASEFLAEKFIGIFSNNKVCPKNLSINSGSVMPTAMLDMSYAGADFLIADETIFSSEDGDIDKYLDNHINLWIVSEDFEKLMVEDEKIEKYIYDSPQIYGIKEYELKGYRRVKFDLNTEYSKLPKTKYEYINLFDGDCPIVVLRKENAGFIVLSDKSLIYNTENCYKVIFELLLKVYLNGYFTTNTRTSYVADNKIDYFIKMYQRFNQYHPRINLNEIFMADGIQQNINYEIIVVNIKQNNVRYLGKSQNGDLLFKKTNKTDPEKSGSAISVFTTKNTIINYDFSANVIKTIEDKLEINYRQNGEQNYITVAPFKSSQYKINTDSMQTIEIPDNNTYVLYYDATAQQFAVVLKTVYDEDKENRYGTIMAIINMYYTEDISCGDIRSFGGGEADIKPNYEMIDTGSILGRPYRVGSTMIITLPERLAKHKDKILKEITKHMASADYPLLVFK